MGRWAYYPMGADGPLDEEYLFLSPLIEYQRNDSWFYSDNPEIVKKYLENLSLDQINETIKFKEIDNNNLYFLPFTFMEFGAQPKHENVSRFLFECLDSIKELESCGDSLDYIKLFKENFDDLLEGKLYLHRMEPKITKNKEEDK